MKPKVIIYLVIAVVILIVLVQNTHVVSLRLLFWEITMFQFLALGFAVILGFVAGYLTSSFGWKNK